MRNLVLGMMIGMPIMITMANMAAADEPTIVICNFEKMPSMILIFRGGMGAKDNTLQVGQSKPVPLSVGSSLMTAEFGAQELVFSLRLPANVSVSAPGQDTQTFYGECISSLQQE